jgi:spermidine synthase
VLVYALAWLSGVAALVYEITWTRRLHFVFGATIRAVSAVLAAYMAGLSLGALVAARRAPRLRSPLAAYAGVELTVALAALYVPSAIAWLRAIDSRWYRDGAAAAEVTALRFVLALFVIGAPAALMGATLPLLVRSVSLDRSDDVGARTTLAKRVAILYAVNTAGAVVGALYAGFYAIGAIGVTRTERRAIVLNLAIAAMAAMSVTLDRLAPRWPRSAPTQPAPASAEDSFAEESSTREDDARAHRGLSPSWIAASALVTGAACVACEVLWTRALAFRLSWLNNSTYTLAAMLALILAGIAAGSVSVGGILARSKRPALVYSVLVALSGAAVSLSAWMLTTRGSAPFGRALDDAHQFITRRAFANVFAETAAVVALPALLMGAAFPAAVRAATQTVEDAPTATGRVYAASTAGSIVGAVLAAFVLAPTVGIAQGVLVLGAALSLTGALLTARASSDARASATTDRRPLASLVIAALSLASPVLVHALLPRRPLLTADDAPVLFYTEGPTATVAVARAADGFLRVDVDGVPVAGTSPTMLTDQKSLAHVPMLLVERPRAALTVGFGSGGTSHSFLLHERLERVRAVEIAPEVLLGAPYLTASNHGVLTRRDPRYAVILDDARSYLAHTYSTYDIIVTDCTDLRYRSNANLYDVEYFSFARARLAPGGVVSVWLPVGGLSRALFKITLRTFSAVFRDFAVFWPNGYPSHYVVLVGWRDPRRIQWNVLFERMSSPAIREDLREISLDDPAKMLSTLIADGASLRAAIADAPINTEDHPVLEFRAPLTGYSPRATTENLEFLVDHRVSATEIVEGVPPAIAARVDRMQRALGLLIEAHGASFAGQTQRARELYREALAIAPDDEALRDRARELERSSTDAPYRVRSDER